MDFSGIFEEFFLNSPNNNFVKTIFETDSNGHLSLFIHMLILNNYLIVILAHLLYLIIIIRHCNVKSKIDKNSSPQI